MGYKIGSFNIRNLGLAAMGSNNERDLSKIAEIIREEEFDVIALQEVLSEGKAFTSPDFAKKSILMELGPYWDFQWANAESETDRRQEGYAFLWNTRRLRLSTVELENHTYRTFYPRICRINKEKMNRRPYYARFTPLGRPGGSYFEIRLLCVHTYYGNDTASDRLIRQHELDVLLKDIYPQIADRVYKGNMPAYTILLGDYNVELRRSWKESWNRSMPAYLNANQDDIVETSDWGERRIKTVQDQLTTLKMKTEENSDQQQDDLRGYAHDYDHFSYEESKFEGVNMRVKRVDAVRKYCGDDFEKYRKTISDHIPVMMEIELK